MNEVVGRGEGVLPHLFYNLSSVQSRTVVHL